jgi:8-oxo-dGTP diphosphatase
LSAAPRDRLSGRVVRIVAAILLDGEGRTLVVRKGGTEAFMQPGGKPVDGESSLAALAREIEEELGCRVEAAAFRPLGRFSAPAANEPGWTVDAELFAAELRSEIGATGEIEEAVWIDPETSDGMCLAPLTRQFALPLAREMKRTRGASPPDPGRRKAFPDRG